MSLVDVFQAICLRDLQIALRRWGDLASPLVFFVMVTMLFPLALSPEPDVLLYCRAKSIP